ncbi:hypothetical protein OMO38_19590 [Chryseobacterium sp. 09-1422]|uniref:GH18 domain-containing protein n=1 Tax=Chryseobacterium kimseyorum TaxID=2984028 RepID=A0ABT3I440_9FLAO|nr:hypothetical protein [Chryseobacterium kimseyorum]MCW3170739.1 hypothetical protein [Chryseobacterium kimseyorum]
MRKLLPFLFVTLFFLFSDAQTTAPLHINSQALGNLVIDYKKIYTMTKDVITNLLADSKSSKNELKKVVETRDQFLSFSNEKRNIISGSELKSVPTINWTSEVNYNFSPGFADEDNIFYRARISSGLDWLALGQGSEKNHKLENSLKRRSSEVDLLENKEFQRKQLYTETLNKLRASFDIRKIKILADYETVLILSHDLSIQQNKLGIKNDGELAHKKHQLNTISIEKKHLQDLINTDSENVFDIDFMQYSLPELISVENLDLKHLVTDKKLALQIQKEMMQMNQKKERQLDLTVKLRYNYYSTPINDRNFASLGASLNLPVTKSKSALYEEAIVQRRESELDNLLISYKDQLSTIYRNYYEILATVQILESESNYLESELKVKSENENSKTFSPAAYLEVAEKFINNQLQLSDQRYKLFEKYTQYKMMSDKQTHDDSSPSFTNTDNEGHETYIWSSLFNNYSNEYIITLLNHWHINRVFLSIGNVTNAVKVENFKTLAAANNILVYRLIGENSYAATDNGFVNLQNALINAKNAGFAGIHLDIEPHTFSDYKDNVDLYSQRLINLFILSKTWCDQNEMALGVSVPMHLPTNIAYTLQQNNIRTYIMAYDVLSLDKKIAKTSVIRNILGNALSVWVFRINDFQNFSDLLDAETTVQNNNIDQIGYYDLSQMNNFKP